tara:strand:+ start:338 stop:514 length:177 start_codon:yes stop_codon:yes gene_type:complete
MIFYLFTVIIIGVEMVTRSVLTSTSFVFGADTRKTTETLRISVIAIFRNFIILASLSY